MWLKPKAKLCIKTCTNKPDTLWFPHTYPDGFMGIPQDSNPKERITSLLAFDQLALLSPLFKYFILSWALTHIISYFNVICIFIDMCKKFSGTNTQEYARPQGVTTMNMPLHRPIREHSIYHYISWPTLCMCISNVCILIALTWCLNVSLI